MPGPTAKSVLGLLNDTTPGYRLLDGSDLATIVSVIASGKSGLTALAGGGSLNAPQISTFLTEFITVASANDSCMLPNAIAGLECQIINSGAQNLRVYANTTNDANLDASGNPLPDTIIPLAGAPGVAFITVAANAAADVVCTALGRWKSLNQ